MSPAAAAAIQSETRISAVINMALSAVLFLAAFGNSPRALAMDAPDNFALDFLPQSLAVGFFAALVPALLVSKKRRKGLIQGINIHADSAQTLVGRAFVIAAICGMFGALLVVSLPLLAGQIAYYPALGLKIIYGGVLAVLVTPRTLRMTLTTPAPSKSEG